MSKKTIHLSDLEHIMLNDIRQMDLDAFQSFVEYMYPITLTNNEDESFSIESTEGDMTVVDIFGEENAKLFTDE